jgi:hypothetical protein
MLLRIHTTPIVNILQVIQALRAAGVVVLGGPKAISAGLIGSESPTPGFKTEYGDNTVSFELVDNMTEAVDHIHKYGSGHTEAIITENATTAQVGVYAFSLLSIYIVQQCVVCTISVLKEASNPQQVIHVLVMACRQLLQIILRDRRCA